MRKKIYIFFHCICLSYHFNYIHGLFFFIWSHVVLWTRRLNLFNAVVRCQWDVWYIWSLSLICFLKFWIFCFKKFKSARKLTLQWMPHILQHVNSMSPSTEVARGRRQVYPSRHSDCSRLTTPPLSPADDIMPSHPRKTNLEKELSPGIVISDPRFINKINLCCGHPVFKTQSRSTLVADASYPSS